MLEPASTEIDTKREATTVTLYCKEHSAVYLPELIRPNGSHLPGTITPTV
jgi:hypothetical protein